VAKVIDFELVLAVLYFGIRMCLMTGAGSREREERDSIYSYPISEIGIIIIGFKYFSY
jgi:hypothetical protein